MNSPDPNPYAAPESAAEASLSDGLYQKALPEKRCLNFLVDSLLIGSVALVCFYPVLQQGYEISGRNTLDPDVVIPLLWWVISTIYYTAAEGITGRTLGKLLTGTKVLTANQKPVSLMQALGRSLCRILPFEPLSILAPQMWHDSISETVVVDLRARKLPRPPRPLITMTRPAAPAAPKRTFRPGSPPAGATPPHSDGALRAGANDTRKKAD